MMDNPIVKPFIYKGCFYMYTPFSNNVVQINCEQFKKIVELKRVGIEQYRLKNSNSPHYSDICNLIDSGLITGPFIREVKHQATDNFTTIVNRRMQRLILQVTQRCNFACRYCHKRHTESARFDNEQSDMSLEVAKQSVDFFLTHSQDSEFINIYFYGGEPLLNFDLIKWVVEYITFRIHTKEINFHITTNASLLTDAIAVFLAKYKFKVSISLDGDRERQNWARKFANGKPTFDVVWERVETLLLNYKDSMDNIKFLPVIFIDEDRNRVLDFFSSHNILANQIIFLDANTSGIDYSHGVVQTETSRAGVVSTKFVDYDKVGEEEYRIFLTEYRNKHAIGGTWHHSGACIPGCFKLFVDTKGNFFPCENSPQYVNMCIGNLTDGINVRNAVSLLNIGRLTDKECKNCWAVRFCNMCMLYCVDEEKKCLSGKVKELNCGAFKRHLLKMFKKYIDEGNCSRGDNDDK